MSGMAAADFTTVDPPAIPRCQASEGFSPEAAGTVVSRAGAAGAAADADSTAAGADSADALESPARPFVSALKMRIDRPRPRAASGSRFAPKSSRMRATMMSHSQPFIFGSMVHPSLGGDVIQVVNTAIARDPTCESESRLLIVRPQRALGRICHRYPKGFGRGDLRDSAERQHGANEPFRIINEHSGG